MSLSRLMRQGRGRVRRAVVRSRRGAMAVGAACCAALAAGPAGGADSTWVGGSGNWSDPAQWAPGPVPDDAADNAIINGGNVLLDQPFSIGGLTFSRGMIRGTNDLTLAGQFAWTGGMLFDPAKLVANGGMTIGGTASKSLDGRILVNPVSATATWTDGEISFANGARFENAGTFAITGQSNISISGTNFGGVIDNSGLIVKSDGPTLIDPRLNNSGTVRLVDSTLGLTGGGSASGRFELEGAASRLLILGGYSMDASSRVSGSGSVTVTAGVFHTEGNYDVGGMTWLLNGRAEFAGSNSAHLGSTLRANAGTLAIGAAGASAGNFEHNGSVLEGAGTLTVNGIVAWAGGTQTGGGVTLAAGGVDLKGGAKTLGGSRTFRQAAGQAGTWSAGDLTLSGDSTFVNDGTLTITYDANVLPGEGATAKFVNNGVLIKSAGTGTTAFNVPLHNGGTVRVSSGVVRVGGGGSGAGHFDLAGGNLELSGGYVLLPGASISGSNVARVLGDVSVAAGGTATASNVIHSGGNFGGDGNFVVENLEWNGGTMSGAGMTEVTGSLALTEVPPAVQRTLGGRRLIIGGSASATWTGGDVVFDGGGVLENRSTLTTNFDGNFFLVEGATGAVQNAGLFIKAGGTGMTSVGLPLHNSGTVRVSSGTIALLGGGVGTGHFDLAAGPLELGGKYDLAPGATFTGTNVLRIVGDVAVNTPISFGAVEQTFGTQSGTGTLSLENFTWRGGTLAGAGTTQVSNTLNLEVGNLFLLGRTLRGGTGTTTVWSSGQIFTGDGSRLINTGTFVTSFNGQMVHHTGAMPAFDNLGEFRKGGFFGTGTTSIEIPFNNTGTARVENGLLRLARGGEGGGAFVVSEGARLELADGYTLAGGGRIGGAGKVLLSGGVLAVPSGKATAANLEQTGGAIGGAGELEIGEYLWTGGQLIGGGGTTSVSQSLKFGAPLLGIVGRSLKINEGATGTWDGGDIHVSAGVAIDNHGNLIIAGDANLTRTDSNSASLRNFGTITKSGGTNVSVFSQVPLDNLGALEVSAGTLRTEAVQFNEPNRALTGGTWRVKSGGTLDLVGAAGIVTNLAHVTLDGETASFPKLAELADNRGTFELKGGHHFVAGPVFNNSGTVRVDATSTMELGAEALNTGVYESAGKTIAQSFENRGRLVHTGEELNIGQLLNSGTGTADLAGPVRWHGLLKVTGGSVILRQDAGEPGDPTLIMEADGGLIDLRASQHLSALKLGAGKVRLEPGGDKLVKAGLYSAQKDGEQYVGQLDLGDGEALLGYDVDGGPAALADIRNQLKSGYNGGGASAWTGNGIVSSVAAGDPSLALGYRDVETEMAVRVALTKFGDANLDGRVSFADFQRLEVGFGADGGWGQGDFDYSGEVDFLDFKLLYDHFGQSMGGGGGAGLSAAQWAGLEAFAAAHAAQVPEPAAMGVIGMAVALGTRRRRR